MKQKKRPRQRLLLAIVLFLALTAVLTVAADVYFTQAYVPGLGFTLYCGSVFPANSTADESAVYSYQSNEVRIAVHELDAESAHYFAADVWVRNVPEDFQCIFAQDTYNGHDQSADLMAQQHNALLAVNSDFNWGLVIRNGVLYSDESWDVPMLVLYRSGKMEIVYDQLSADPQKLLDAGAWDTWTFGPVLVDGGKIVVEADDADTPEPRTAIGYYCPGHYCFLVADGRQSGYSAGLRYTELADIMQRLGCKVAYNFDGGASSQMVIEGELINRPSSYPPRLQKNLIAIPEP